MKIIHIISYCEAPNSNSEHTDKYDTKELGRYLTSSLFGDAAPSDVPEDRRAELHVGGNHKSVTYFLVPSYGV